jgi:hypothetical protein
MPPNRSAFFHHFRTIVLKHPSRLVTASANLRRHDMFSKPVSLTLASAMLGLGLTTGITAPAAAAEKLAFAAEIESCVTAVTSRLDLERAKRVRHLVSNAKRTGIGYVLTIETAVFFEGSEKNYEASCVANGNNVPVKFQMEELDT